MEQSQKFMWLRKTPFSASLNSSFNQTWEERASGEDTTGTLGHACIWPPRSYSCAFCKREFRSAQALGGHMNIHRRERAMLKQSTCNQHPGIYSSSRSSALSYHFIKHCSPDNSLTAQEPQRFFTQAAQTLCGVTFPRPEVNNAVGEEDLIYQSCDLTSVKISHKRARTGFSSLPSILNPCATNNWHSHVEEGITESNSISTDQGLDLELRLGDLPRVD